MIGTALTATLLAAWVTIRLAPETPTAQLLDRWLAQQPARLLLKVERRHLIFILVAALSAQALLSVGLPDLALAAAWDVSTYLDILLVTWTLAAVTNLKAGGIAAQKSLRITRNRRLARTRPRAKRRLRSTTEPRSANDDDRPAPHRRAA